MNAYTGDRAGKPSSVGASPASSTGSGIPEERFELSNAIAVLWRQKFVVAAICGVFGLLAMVAAYSLTPIYRADAVVMLDRSEDQVIDLESVVSGFAADYYSILAEAEVLRSRKLAGRVVDKLDLTNHPLFNPDLQEDAEPPVFVGWIFAGVDLIKDLVRGSVTDREVPGRELLPLDYFLRKQAVDLLLENLSVTSIDNTYVYRIVVSSEDPLLSADIANAFASLYITEQLEKKFEATQAATEWLASQVAELKVELEASEALVEEYNSTSTLISEEALALRGRQLKDLRERREELVVQRDADADRSARLDAALAAGDAEAVGEAGGDPQLANLIRRYQALQPGDAQRDVLRDRIDVEVERARTVFAIAQERYARQIDGLNESIDDLEEQLAEQTEDLVGLRQLQREAEANRVIYEQFLRRLNETSVQQGVQQPDARVLSEAVVEFNPSFPNKTLIVLFAVFFGGVFGSAAVIALEQMNRRFRSSDDLENATGLSVLGTIPAAPVRNRRDLLRYSRESGSSNLMEAVRNLRTGILLSRVDQQPKVIMLTSSLPKEGKTTCSLLLAQNAAQLGRKVLLIECDLRRRTFGNYFPTIGEDGLVALLSGRKTLDEAIHQDPDTGLHVIGGDETQANAADLFSSRKFAEFIGAVRERFDFVVIDTPPVLAVPDARIIAPLADAIVYCVRWNSTHRGLVRSGLTSFQQINVSVSGLALTQVNLRKQASYGYGGYNSYYYKSARGYYTN